MKSNIQEEIRSIEDFIDKRKTLARELECRRDLYKDAIRYLDEKDVELKRVLEADIEMINEFLRVSDLEIERATKKTSIMNRLKQRELDFLKETARLVFEQQTDSSIAREEKND